MQGMSFPSMTRSSSSRGFPPCRVFYFSGARLELGVEERSGSSGPVIVYDREKTICDVLRFRSAIGPDVAMEALSDYVREAGRNIPKLLGYARQLRMEGTLRGLLEALL